MSIRVLLAMAAVFLAAAFSYAQVKKPVPPKAKAPFERALQAVVVITPDWTSTKGLAHLFGRKNTRSPWMPVDVSFPVVVGRNGLGRSESGNSPEKREGDGRAPAGMFPLTFSFGTTKIGSRLPFKKLEESTECVDDVNSTHYNKIVDRYKVGNFDWKSSEKMLDVGPQYELGVFVAYNSYPVVRGNGSCIFLHIWKDAETGTAGCIAMARENLETIVKWLDPKKNPYLIQMPEAEYNARQTSLRLPKLK